MKIHIEIDEERLRQLILEDLQSQLGELPIQLQNIVIEVKSAQNYRSEWEVAKFRAIYDVTL